MATLPCPIDISSLTEFGFIPIPGKVDQFRHKRLEVTAGYFPAPCDRDCALKIRAGFKYVSNVRTYDGRTINANHWLHSVQRAVCLMERGVSPIAIRQQLKIR